MTVVAWVCSLASSLWILRILGAIRTGKVRAIPSRRGHVHFRAKQPRAFYWTLAMFAMMAFISGWVAFDALSRSAS